MPAPREVHFRIASPPITHPDYYGIDTPERDKLLAATHDLEGMRQFIGADSLAFLSVDGIYRAMGYESRDPARPQFTDHCFTGDYPTPLTDRATTQPAATLAARRGELRQFIGRRHAFSRLSCSRRRPSPLRSDDDQYMKCRNPSPTASRSSPAPRAVSATPLALALAAPARMWSRSRAPSAALKSLTTPSRRRRLGNAGAARPEGLPGHRSARRGAERALRQARHARRQCRDSRRALAARPYRAESLGRRHGDQRHRQLASDPRDATRC